eukprot:658788-Prymnesium_polylepis.1
MGTHMTAALTPPPAYDGRASPCTQQGFCSGRSSGTQVSSPTNAQHSPHRTPGIRNHIIHPY